MAPHLVRWDKKWRKAGLRIIDIDNGTIDSQEKIKKEIGKKGKTYPVLWDHGGKNCTRYGIKAYPAAYLLDVDGKVVWEGIPMGPKIPDIEKEIAKQLQRIEKPKKKGGE